MGKELSPKNISLSDYVESGLSVFSNPTTWASSLPVSCVHAPDLLERLHPSKAPCLGRGLRRDALSSQNLQSGREGEATSCCGNGAVAVSRAMASTWPRRDHTRESHERRRAGSGLPRVSGAARCGSVGLCSKYNRAGSFNDMHLLSAAREAGKSKARLC